jgi:transposase
MHYNVDLRRKAISAMERGVAKAEVARTFGINRQTLYNWLGRGDDLAPKLARTRLRKVDAAKLKALVEATPDARLIYFARHMNVAPSARCYQFKKLGITKKNDTVRGTKVYGTV